MAQIKEVIDSLCKIFTQNGFTSITPETFRRAKFDNPDAVKPLWILHFELLDFLRTGKIHRFGGVGETMSYRNMICAVKAVYFELGYYFKTFYDLPVGGNGSRVLLLTFAWLMAKECIVEKLSNMTAFPLLDLFMDNGKRTRGIDGSSLTSRRSNQDLSEVDKMNNILFLHGKTTMEYRNLRLISDYFVRLINELHSLSSEESTKKFLKTTGISVLGAFVLSRSEEQELVITILENERSLLKAHTKWIQNESLFWKWMDSVLEQQINAGSWRSSDVESKAQKSESEGLDLDSLMRALVMLDDEKFSFVQDRLKIREKVAEDPTKLTTLSASFSKFNSNATQKDEFVPLISRLSTCVFLFPKCSTIPVAARRGNDMNQSDTVISRQIELLSEKVLSLRTEMHDLATRNKEVLNDLSSVLFLDVIQLPPPRR